MEIGSSMLHKQKQYGKTINLLSPKAEKIKTSAQEVFDKPTAYIHDNFREIHEIFNRDSKSSEEDFSKFQVHLKHL